MPTPSPEARLRRSQVAWVVRAATFPDRGREHPDGVGVEAELFAVRRRQDGATERVPLVEAAAVARAWAERTHGVVPTSDHPALLGFALGDGTRITFEPGGQIEVSGVAVVSPSDAASHLQDVLSGLAAAFDEQGVVLVSAGTDLWHDVTVVPQQLRSPRYPAMAAYFAARSDQGAVMMRHTCALQVNLDAGAGTVRDERWLVANLAAPLAVGSFSTSPGTPPGPASLRASAWRRLDPTRTGVPPALVADEPDPVRQLVDAALRADVLLVRHGDEAVPGEAGWSFGAWLRDGHPRHGWPTEDDLRYHLTTLFHEVRPRGSLEIRSIDALPARWRVVPLVLYAGLLYDDRTRRTVLRVLAPLRGRLPDLLERATQRGVADAELCAAAVETWSYAVEGARRLGAGVVAPADLGRAEAFIDRFTMRGRCPGDELRERFEDDPAAAMAWAVEPVPTVTLC